MQTVASMSFSRRRLARTVLRAKRCKRPAPSTSTKASRKHEKMFRQDYEGSDMQTVASMTFSKRRLARTAYV